MVDRVGLSPEGGTKTKSIDVGNAYVFVHSLRAYSPFLTISGNSRKGIANSFRPRFLFKKGWFRTHNLYLARVAIYHRDAHIVRVNLPLIYRPIA